MLTCKLQGGIGNQMFQIATTYSLAISNNDKAVFNFNDCYTPNQGFSASKYKNTLFKNVKEITNYNGFINQYNELTFSFNRIPYKPNMLLNGYYQTEKYFKEHKKEIIDLFFINPVDINYIKERYNDIDFNNTVSVHIRRGDYLKFSDYHIGCSLYYYKEAINYFKNKNFIFVSDDIEWCKENFKGENYFFSDLNDEVLDLTLITICEHNIIANSSFSWWGSYLNKNENKKVIAPKTWFNPYNPNTPKDTEDIYCENWIKL